ncbi:glycosyltransferase [Methanosphaera sp. ISO3-F5]|uniref:glycosyltransferase n=1 Tax=Methanosphaera sp. ISO3-F5 TaxID=1452353 RepID=UPI002B25AE63|nr:glycosyltransferase [Methanosphaera sp. ISO3-F5]WQH63449.1 glycosyltransferase [Methanosphaera sp. ISO3-F5]
MYDLSIILMGNDDEKIKNIIESILENNDKNDLEKIEFIINNDLAYANLNKRDLFYLNINLINSKDSFNGYNQALNNAKGSYLFFHDLNDTLFNYSINLMISSIKNKGNDILVYDYINVNKNEYIPNKIFSSSNKNSELNINNMDLISNHTILGSYLFKRKLLIDNNIQFRSLLDYNFVFIIETLLHSDNISYLNKILLKHGLKNRSNDFSYYLSKIDTFNYLSDLINNEDPNFLDCLTYELINYIENFIKSDLSKRERFDIIIYGSTFFENFVDKLDKRYDKYNLFLRLIKQRLINESVEVSLLLKNIITEDTVELINLDNREIIFVFYGLEYEIGGMAKAIFNRANILVNQNLNITLINLEPYVNHNILEKFHDYNFIEKNFRKLGYLDENLKLFNIFDYLYKKNSTDKNDTYQSDEYNLINKSKKVNFINDYIIESIDTQDDSEIYYYYDLNDFEDNEITVIKKLNTAPIPTNLEELSISKDFNKKILKSELYIGDTLRIRNEYHKSNYILFERFYGNDGFNFLTIHHHKGPNFILKNKNNKSEIYFKSIQELFGYLLEYYCLSSSNKPFLVNDCSGPIPSIENVSGEVAYTIGNLHSNPYLESHCYGSKMREISILKNIKKLDSLITLTNSEQKDLIKEFKTDNIFVIPNTLDFKEIIELDQMNIPKNNKKFSIFARIASEKNLSDLIQAFAQVTQVDPDVFLCIYGRSLTDDEIKEYEKLKKLIKELHLENNVFFKGHIENVSEEIRTSIATLLVSDIEGMPMVIIESMMNKVPVISYDINFGPRDVITNNVDGFIVKQYDIDELSEKILYLSKHPELSETMGIKARENIMENYSSDKIYTKWANVFQKTYAINTLKKYKLLTDLNENRTRINELENNLNESKLKIKRDNIQLNKNINLLKHEIEQENHNINIIHQDTEHINTTIKYYQVNSKFKRKILFFLPFLYILYCHKDIISTFKLYYKLQDNPWFNIGYYLDKNQDISRKKWCEYLTIELHYVCHGFYEKRLPNHDYKNNLTKEQLINILKEDNNV